MTVNGASFVPSTQTCDVNVCDTASVSCKVISSVSIEFVVNSATVQGICLVSFRLQNPFFVIQSSIMIASLPLLNATVLPSSTYFGSMVNLYFTNLFMPPLLCFSSNVCFTSVEFSEKNAVFRMPSSKNVTIVSPASIRIKTSIRIKNPDYQVGLLSNSFYLTKGLQIHSTSSSVAQQHASFFIHGTSFLPSCSVRDAGGTQEVLEITVVNGTAQLYRLRCCLNRRFCGLMYQSCPW